MWTRPSPVSRGHVTCLAGGRSQWSVMHCKSCGLTCPFLEGHCESCGARPGPSKLPRILFGGVLLAVTGAFLVLVI